MIVENWSLNLLFLCLYQIILIGAWQLLLNVTEKESSKNVLIKRTKRDSEDDDRRWWSHFSSQTKNVIKSYVRLFLDFSIASVDFFLRNEATMRFLLESFLLCIGTLSVICWVLVFLKNKIFDFYFFLNKFLSLFITSRWKTCTFIFKNYWMIHNKFLWQIFYSSKLFSTICTNIFERTMQEQQQSKEKLKNFWSQKNAAVNNNFFAQSAPANDCFFDFFSFQ